MCDTLYLYYKFHSEITSPPQKKTTLKSGGTVCDIGLWLQFLTPAVDNHLISKTTYSFIFVFICLSRKYLWRGYYVCPVPFKALETE